MNCVAFLTEIIYVAGVGMSVSVCVAGVSVSVCMGGTVQENICMD